VSSSGDAGVPYGLVTDERRKHDGLAGSQWRETMASVADKVWTNLHKGK
jgi:ATP-binding protein involved in chromosome partitioning